MTTTTTSSDGAPRSRMMPPLLVATLVALALFPTSCVGWDAVRWSQAAEDGGDGGYSKRRRGMHGRRRREDDEDEEDEEGRLSFFEPDFFDHLGRIADNLTSTFVDPLHGTPLPRRCERKIVRGQRLSDWCKSWLAANPQYVLPSRSPNFTPFPTYMPTNSPSVGPTAFSNTGRTKFETLDEDGDGEKDVIEFEWIVTNDDETAEEDDVDKDNDASSSSSPTIEVVNATVKYTIGPTDDTFLEAYRPNAIFGDRTKLKLDAIGRDDDGDVAGGGGAGGGMPTKVILLKFGLGTTFDELASMMIAGANNGTVVLRKAELRMFALSDANFGGYVTMAPRRGGMGRGDGGGGEDGRNNDDADIDIDDAVNDWNEEDVAWSSYVDGGRRDAMKLLPDEVDDDDDGNDGGNDRDDSDADESWRVLQEDENTGEAEEGGGWDERARTRNPELGRFGGAVTNRWTKADITRDVIEGMLTSRMTTGTTSGGSGATKSRLSLMITTDSTDGVIYASKENSEWGGPFLDLTFELYGLNVIRPSSIAADPSQGPASSPAVIVDGEDDASSSRPSRSPVPSISPPPTSNPVAPLIRPFKPGQEGGIDAMTPIAEEVATTSVVSSSFRMALTAIETGRRRRRDFVRSADRRRILRQEDGTAAASHPSIDTKEEPAIIEHLTRVYGEVLSIPPIGVSLAFEEDLVVEDIGTGTDGETRGVIRKSVFRVMAVFDDPEVEKMPFEAVEILDEATSYAFAGQEELEFIEVFKSTGDPIVGDPSEYDVTVLKIYYLVTAEEDNLEDSPATVGDPAIDASEGDGEGDPSTTAPPSSPSWIKPAFIAGACVVALASISATFLLWRQRRGDAYVDEDGHKGDSPRSHDPTTVPSTPSPAVFMDRFGKNKTQFDYAEFDDDNVDVKDPSFYAEGDVVVDPPINGDERGLVNLGSVPNNHQPTDDIEYAKHNISFDYYDDSSVSDVSAHLLGARGSIKRSDANASQVESLLLDTTMESYNMDAMSALDQVRFEDVLNVDASSRSGPTVHGRSGRGIIRVTSDDEVGCSLSTGMMPSDLYSNLSLDESDNLRDNSNVASYGGQYFALDLLRNRDGPMVDMPPPPSDVASDASSQQDLEGDLDGVDNILPGGGIDFTPTREASEQDAISHSINDELRRVIQLLESPENVEEGQAGVSADRSHYIGTVEGHTVIGNDYTLGKDEVNASGYEGVSVIVNCEPEPDENEHLKQMNEALSDCRDILEKARSSNKGMPSHGANDENYVNIVDAGCEKDGDGWNAAIEDETSSLMTEQID